MAKKIKITPYDEDAERARAIANREKIRKLFIKTPKPPPDESPPAEPQPADQETRQTAPAKATAPKRNLFGGW